MEENSLLLDFILATELPPGTAAKFLSLLLEEQGVRPEQATLEDLRRLTENLLLDVVCDIVSPHAV